MISSIINILLFIFSIAIMSYILYYYMFIYLYDIMSAIYISTILSIGIVHKRFIPSLLLFLLVSLIYLFLLSQPRYINQFDIDRAYVLISMIYPVVITTLFKIVICTINIRYRFLLHFLSIPLIMLILYYTPDIWLKTNAYIYKYLM